MLYPNELQAHSLRIIAKSDWSGQRDLNPRPPAPKAGALPDCAMPRAALRICYLRKARHHTQRTYRDQLKKPPHWPRLPAKCLQRPGASRNIARSFNYRKFKYSDG